MSSATSTRSIRPGEIGAATGAGAFGAAEAFDLVFMDVEMPGMDGLEATRELRTIEAEVLAGRQTPEAGSSYAIGRRIPIIALTAHAMTMHQEQCLAAGMDDYVSKPVNPTTLAAAIARLA